MNAVSAAAFGSGVLFARKLRPLEAMGVAVLWAATVVLAARDALQGAYVLNGALMTLLWLKLK